MRREKFMKGSNSEQKQVKRNINNSQLVQVAVLCLSAVSLFTTAQGMNEYIFKVPAISYAASAAIQGILLAMSMGLPAYIHNVFENQWKIFWKIFVSAIIILLTIVTMFCSSWFSYIYIAEVVHFDSWQTDSELLVQQTYRAELYDARDYAHAYRSYLENSLGEKIIVLEELAEGLAENEQMDNLQMNWSEERLRYEETLVAVYMIPIVDTMETAMGEGSNQNLREQAARVIEDTKTNINDRKEIVNEELENSIEKINNYDGDIESLTKRINNATVGTDTTSLENALNNTIRLLESETERRTSFELESEQLDGAISRLQIYETYLGLNNSTSSIAIKSQLLEMQTEFFAEDPDQKALLNTAEAVFTSLRNAATYEDKDKLSYTNLLVQMNQLILNLKDYAIIKEIESQLETYINNFALRDKNIKEEDWKKNWRNQLENLKSVISSMPIYTDIGVSEGETSSLTDYQLEMLQSYNRNEASGRLDDMIRLYIVKHNALYQGLIYLGSPYNKLAWFALILAFAFDVSGFIFGFINQGEVEKEKVNKEEKYDSEIGRKVTYGKRKDKVSWSILTTLNKYRILTGDYEKKDGIYSYQVFEDGLLQTWNVEDTVSYKYGIYVQNPTVKTKGTEVQRIHQEILFYGQQGGPNDGIYLDCSLKFNEGSLLLVKEINDTKYERFLVNLYEYVPVHSYSLSRGESRTVPVRDLTKDNFVAQMAVLALNDKGSRIAAIYILEE